jgi:hypothetical protein
MGIVEVLAVTFVAYVTVVAIVMIAGWHHKLSNERIGKFRKIGPIEDDSNQKEKKMN